MSDSVHGHAILEMLMEAPRPMTREALRDTASRRFGTDVRYHTCSSEGMLLDELVAFLLERGKISEHDGLLIAHPEEMCSHN